MLKDSGDFSRDVGPVGRIFGGIFCVTATAFLFWLCGYFIYLYRFEPRSLAPGAQYLFVFVLFLLLFMLRVTYLFLKPKDQHNSFSVFGGPRKLIIACWIMLGLFSSVGVLAIFNAIKNQSLADIKGIVACPIVVAILLKTIASIKAKSLAEPNE